MPRGLGSLAEGGLEHLQLLGLDRGPRPPALGAARPVLVLVALRLVISVAID